MANFEPLVRVDADGNIVSIQTPDSGVIGTRLDALSKIASGSEIQTHTEGTAGQPDASFTGHLGTEQFDVISVALTAGTTYTFAERGLEDPYLLLYSPDGKYITEDDDGGLGRSSMITYTPTTSGDYLLLASSWYHLDPSAPGYPSADQGDYTVTQWQSNPATDVGGTFATAADLGTGTTYGNLEAANDRDMYQIDLTAGQLYSFTYNGGIASSGDWEDPTTPGESIGVLSLYDNSGNLIAANVDYETGLSYFAEDSGTYYLQVDPYESTMTGGYTLDVSTVNPADSDPLDSINWRDAANVPFVDTDGDGVGDTAYVYFAPAGVNYGELADDGVTPMTTYGWTDWQEAGVMAALQQYEHILGTHYVVTDDPDQATFRMMTTTSDDYGAYAYPQDPAYGTQKGILVFNLESGGFGDFPESLDQGGFSYAVVLHEFGHAHGLAHTHDDGGGSDIMLGVNGAQGSLGVYDLNQGVYTVMSYNDGWVTDPDGAQPLTGATVGFGWSGSLGAFDIAELQHRYGIHAYNEGDTTYTLPDTDASGTFFQTIWDSGGTDTINYAGQRDAQIDLLAATLDYTPTGGGVVSWAEGVHGGYTIANGVVIENASGGAGDDTILGNSAANVLSGNNGLDNLFGREGNDTLNGGNGDDALNGGDGNDTLNGGNGIDHLNGGAGDDSLVGGKGSDVFVFSDSGTDTIVGYEKGEDIDLSALGVTMADVTIKSNGIVVDLDGSDDLTISFNTKGFSKSDLIFVSQDDSTGTGTGTSNHGNGGSNGTTHSPLAVVDSDFASTALLHGHSTFGLSSFDHHNDYVLA